MKFTITLGYQGKEYTYQQEFNETNDAFMTVEELVEYMYTEGNYACDCNRSLFLQRYCGVSIKDDPHARQEDDEEWELPCGDTIKLLSLSPRPVYPKQIIYLVQPSRLYLPMEL